MTPWHVEAVVAACRAAALEGNAAPTNEALAILIGAKSTSSPVKSLTKAVLAGLITIERGNRCRVIAAADGSWRTAGVVTNKHWRDRGPDYSPSPRAKKARRTRAQSAVRTSRPRMDSAASLHAALAAQPVAAPPPPAPRPEPRPEPRPMIRLSRGDGCRFPQWGDGPPTHVYCDAPRARSFMPYCEACCRIAYRQAEAA